jgi:hypothetical protein
MKEITGTISLTLGDATIASAGPPHTYFGVAQELLPAITILANAAPSPWAVALLCAHTLECLLKAYLSRSGTDTHLKHPQVRHNLGDLWRHAAIAGLSVHSNPPDWVERLGALHDTPYYLRYSTGVNGVVTPPPGLMASELAALFELVRTRLQ